MHTYIIIIINFTFIGARLHRIISSFFFFWLLLCSSTPAAISNMFCLISFSCLSLNFAWAIYILFIPFRSSAHIGGGPHKESINKKTDTKQSNKLYYAAGVNDILCIAHTHTPKDAHFQCNKCKSGQFWLHLSFWHAATHHTNNANAANHIAEQHSQKNTYIFGIKWLTWLTRLIRC